MLHRIPVFRNLYAWIRAWSTSRSSSWALFAFTAADNLFLPVPAEVLEYALCAARPERAYRYAAIVIGGTAVGAAIAYVVGLALHGLFDPAILRREFGSGYFWAAFLAPLSPLSDKLVAYGAGVFRVPFFVYLGAMVLGITIRAMVTATLFRIFGPRAQPWFERHAATGFLIVIAMGLAGFAVWLAVRG